MPFDIAPVELPPAHRLAKLIEIGVAANPDLRQGHGQMLKGNRACALGFAALGLGLSRERVAEMPGPYGELRQAIGKTTDDLVYAVWVANDMHTPLGVLVDGLYGRKPPTLWQRLKARFLPR